METSHSRHKIVMFLLLLLCLSVSMYVTFFNWVTFVKYINITSKYVNMKFFLSEKKYTKFTTDPQDIFWYFFYLMQALSR